MLVCLSPRLALTRKSGGLPSMRFPRHCHRQNLCRLSTCRIAVVCNHTQLSLATTTSRFFMDPETLFNYVIRNFLVKDKQKCTEPDLIVEKLVFFLSGARLCPTNFWPNRRRARVTKRMRKSHPQPSCCQNGLLSLIPSAQREALQGSLPSCPCTDWPDNTNLCHWQLVYWQR
jgi:hypothetical protein